MRILSLFSCMLLMLCIFSSTSIAQDDATTLEKIANFPTKFIGKLNRKAQSLEEKLMAQTEKALRKLEKQEEKLKQKWWF